MTACAADPSVGDGHSALARGKLPPDFEMTCAQLTLVFPIAAETAARYVPAQRTLALDANGNAQLMVPIKKCSSFRIPGSTEYGPLDFFVAWISVQGPYEVTEVPGTVVTQPTLYIEYIDTFFDSFQFWLDMRKAGLDIRRAAQVAVGAPGSSGYAHEEGVVGFSWQELGMGTPVSAPIGWNIVAYRDHDVTPSVERIACAFRDSVNGYVSLSVGNGSALAPFGSTLLGGTLDANVECSVSFAAP